VADLVSVVGVTHNPHLPGMIAADHDDPVLAHIVDHYDRLRTRLHEQDPELLIVVASDHLNQWFTDNMPSFLVGKSAVADGPFPHETRLRGLAPYRATVHGSAARSVLRMGLQRGIDFASSDEFMLDHAFTVPLHFLRPEMDLPIVPIFTNVMAPPLPPAARFHAVGMALASIVSDLSEVERVAIVTSGHLALDVGGPQPSGGSADADFDTRMMDLLAAGDIDQLIRTSSYDELISHGNATAGFLNYLLVVGSAGAVPPDDIALYFPQATAAVPAMMWERPGSAVA
jgi:protocatechuate 4,5-dioxygenase beta chain